MSSAPRSNALIVLGMHRSGTSALTGVLAKLGAHPGPTLLPAIAEVNAKGFWEHPGVVDVHKRLLESHHTAWHDVVQLPPDWWRDTDTGRFVSEIREILERDFVKHPLWVLKDPRMCRLLPIWEPVFAELEIEAHYAIALRSPLAVAASLAKRDGLSFPHGCLLWLVHMIAAERSTRSARRALVSYDDLLNDWRETMSRLSNELSLNLPIDDDDTIAEIDAFLDPGLKHHAGESISGEHPAVVLAHDLYTRLTHGGIGQAAAAVDSIAPEAEKLSAVVAPWSDAINALRNESDLVRAEADMQTQLAANLAHEVARVKSTFSWRITAPLRVLANLPRFLLSK